MTTEKETASTAARRNVRDDSAVTTTHASDTKSEPNARNRGKGSGQGGTTRRGGHQGRGGKGGHFNRPPYTSSIRNFKGEVDNFGSVLGTNAKQ